MPRPFSSARLPGTVSRWTTFMSSRTCTPVRLQCRWRSRSPMPKNDMLGRDLIAAVVAGYEVGLRVPGSPRPENSSCAAIISRDLRHRSSPRPPRPMRCGCRPRLRSHAFGTGGTFGAGLVAAQEGAMVKRLHAGRAAQWRSPAPISRAWLHRITEHPGSAVRRLPST